MGNRAQNLDEYVANPIPGIDLLLTGWNSASASATGSIADWTYATSGNSFTSNGNSYVYPSGILPPTGAQSCSSGMSSNVISNSSELQDTFSIGVTVVGTMDGVAGSVSPSISNAYSNLQQSGSTMVSVTSSCTNYELSILQVPQT